MIAAFSLGSLLLAFGASAQVEDLVQINPLMPGQAGGCYAGTPGTDATMFIRSHPGAQGCDLFDLNPDLCLSRREVPGDGANGIPVSFGDMALLRPAMTGDGSVVFFVNNLDLCAMFSNQVQQEACYMLPPTHFFHGIAVAPQGNLLGMVPRDLNNINVPANAIQVFGIGTFPTLPLLALYPFNSPVLFPETLDFMARGPWIVFDASTSSAPGGQWGLYLIDRNTGQIHILAAPVAGYELHNPVFGQTSDDVLVFEAVSTTTGLSTVLTANLLTGDVRKIADLDIGVGIPGFNGDDTAIIFNRGDAGVFSTISLRRRLLLTDRITPFGAEQPYLSDGGFATIYRRGSFDDSSVACPEPGLALGLLAPLPFLAWRSRARRMGAGGVSSLPRYALESTNESNGRVLGCSIS